jgi:putative membrane protein insertion efficiency factor
VSSRPVRVARMVVVSPIVVYQKVISPGLPRRCRYEPTCSHYAVQAVKRYGILRGVVLAVWRLLRCNPFSPGGWDPVEAQHLFSHRRGEGDAPARDVCPPPSMPSPRPPIARA